MGDEEKSPNFRDVIFLGFRSPNYTTVPDEVFDLLLPRLSGAELKVLLYVMRRTYGWKKGSDRISRSQFETGITKKTGDVLDRGTGLSRRAIRLALRSLVDKNILLKRRITTTEKGHESTEYALNIVGNNPWVQSTQGGESPWVKNTQGENSPGDVEESTQGEGYEVPKGLGREVPTQDTVLQETVNNTVNAKRAFKESEKEQNGDAAAEREATSRMVALDILSVLKDDQSRGFYLKVARRVPSEVIYHLISEIRADIINNPQSKVQNPASIFTKRIKEIAAERGIQL